MKLYCTTGERKNDLTVKWSGTAKDAKNDRFDLKQQDCNFIDTCMVDVPTDKKGLLEFLNKHEVIVEENGEHYE